MADEFTNPTPAVAPEPSTDVALTSDDKTMGLLAHLGGILFGFIPSLVIWLMKKDTSKFLDDQGKEALNFQITMVFAHVACFILMFLVIGVFLWPIVWLVNLIFCILGGLAANKGEKYRYPFAIRLIK
jgi:uncharacterized Tic20 family protein